MKRGPKAYDILLKICRQHFADAALFLERDEISTSSSIIGYNEIPIGSAEEIPQGSNQNLINNNNNNYNLNSNQETSTIILEPYKLDEKSKLKLIVKKSIKYHKHKILQTYDMKSKNRGILFLVNIINFKGNEPRRGAQIDRDNLISLFRQMNFEIFYYEDITVNVSYKLKFKKKTFFFNNNFVFFFL